MTKPKIGDKVSRQIYMDDGTWTKLGDSCLPDSPRKYGKVTKIVQKDGDTLYRVQWDNGKINHYFWWGVGVENNHTN